LGKIKFIFVTLILLIGGIYLAYDYLRYELVDVKMYAVDDMEFVMKTNRTEEDSKDGSYYEYNYSISISNPNEHKDIKTNKTYTYVNPIEYDLESVKNADIKCYAFFEIYKDRLDGSYDPRFIDQVYNSKETSLEFLEEKVRLLE
jgi:hypothetical protein